MAGIPLRRRRGPMSAAQKAALKKAQEISARKRRGSGKPDAPTTQRMASLAKKPSAPQYPNEGPSPVVRKRRKAQPKDIMKPTAGDGVTKYQYNPDLSVAENMRLQKEFDAKKNAPKPQKPSSTTGSRKGVTDTQGRTFEDVLKANSKAMDHLAAGQEDPVRSVFVMWRNSAIAKNGGSEAGIPKWEEWRRANFDKMRTEAAKSKVAQKPSSTKGSGNSVTTKTGTHKVGDAVNIGTGGQVWRILSIDGDNVTVKGELQLNANSKQTRVFKADRITYNRTKDNPDRWPNKAQSDAAPKANAPKASGVSSKAIGDRPDPGTMGVSQILKERKELIAKRNGEGLSKEEAARLVAIQAESALRHQNRKAGKGTGPTKVALSDKKPDAPKATGKKDQPDLKSMRMIDLLKMQNDRKTLPAVRKMIDQELSRRADEATGIKREVSGPWKSGSNDKGSSSKYYDVPSSSTKKKTASSVQVGDIIRTYDGDRKVVAVERKSDGSYSFTTERKGSTGTGQLNVGRNEQLDIINASTLKNDANSARLKINDPPKNTDGKTSAPDSAPKNNDVRLDSNGKRTNDNTRLSDLRNSDYNAIDKIHTEMADIAENVIGRMNVLDGLDSADKVGDLVDAAQDIYWYLDEAESMRPLSGKETAAKNKMDKMFEELKKYSDRYRTGR